MTTAGAIFVAKDTKLRPAPVPMIIEDGSPTRVAAPPMLAANASAMRNGAAPISSRSHTNSVTGAINKIVVTLSKKADPTAVTSNSRIRIFSGDPLARLAAEMAMYSNTPVWRTTLTMIIIPRSRNMTSQSIPVSSE